MECAERIRALREDHDYKQSVLAELLHVAQNTYSGYENGKIEIPVKYLVILAEFYNVDLNYISGISNIKNTYPVK